MKKLITKDEYSNQINYFLSIFKVKKKGEIDLIFDLQIKII